MNMSLYTNWILYVYHCINYSLVTCSLGKNTRPVRGLRCHIGMFQSMCHLVFNPSAVSSLILLSKRGYTLLFQQCSLLILHDRIKNSEMPLFTSMSMFIVLIVVHPHVTYFDMANSFFGVRGPHTRVIPVTNDEWGLQWKCVWCSNKIHNACLWVIVSISFQL